MFLRRLRQELVFAAVTVAALGGTAPVVGAGTGPATVRGRFAGAPPAERVRVDIRAIRVETAEIVGAGSTRGAMRRFRLAVPAGPTMLFGYAVDPRRSREYDGASAVLRLQPGGRAHALIDARGWSGPARGASVPAGRLSVTAAAGTRYVGVRQGEIVITGLPGFPGGFRGLAGEVTTHLSQAPCHGSGFQIVEVDRVDELLQEIALSQSPYADPAMRLENRIITPDYYVQGSGVATPDGNLALELQVVEAGTGSVVASADASGPVASLNDLLAEIDGRLACELCTPGTCAAPPSGNWSGTITFVSSVDTEVHALNRFKKYDDSSHERTEHRWDVSGTGTHSETEWFEQWDLDATWTGSQSIDVSTVLIKLDGCIGNSGYGTTTQHDSHSEGAASGISLTTADGGMTYSLELRVTEVSWTPNSWEVPSQRTYVECTGLSSSYEHNLQVVEQLPGRQLTADPGDPNLLTGTDTMTFEDPTEGGSTIVTFTTTWNLRRTPP